jgi:carbamoyl-phosphate synthase small subunit
MTLLKRATLVLEDGRTFNGASFGAVGEAFGEMVFNTSMSGYQEIVTDPSYAGQIVCMTYPLIGNYGTNDEDVESRRPWVEGFVVREASRVASNFRSTKSLQNYLKDSFIVGIEHIDTRALVRHIRDKGAMRSAISTIDLDAKSLLDKIMDSPGMANRELASAVTAPSDYSHPAIGEERFHMISA